MENLLTLTKEEKNTMKMLEQLAEDGNSRACLILSILNESTITTKKFHLKIISPMLEAAGALSKSFKDPKFRDHLQKKKDSLRKKDNSTDV
jgi:hypothetical protein